MSQKIILNSILLGIGLLFSNCKEDSEFKFKTPKKININKDLTFSVSEINNNKIDSVAFYLDGKKISSKNNDTYSIKNEVLGKHTISAWIYFNEKTKKINNHIFFLAEKKPTIYDYKIINTYPHDPTAFTQGFEYYNGFLYESTGIRGASSIRKTVLKTGEILKKIDLDKQYFGEGITLFNNKIYQLTWQSKSGFIYDLETFELERSFSYGESTEGWGLTHNKNELIKSDGTERIWFLDPNTLKETHFIEAYTNRRKAERLNEIEYIHGKIYANIWQKNTIVIIDSQNGSIDGVVNLNDLQKKTTQTNSSKQYVLNGIAYDAKNDRLFVTGKNWDKTFEIKLLEK